MIYVSSATLRYIKVPARKIRFVVSPIRQMPVNKAFAFLSVQNKKAFSFVEKTLKSAVANVNNRKDVENIDLDGLYIKEIMVDEGPTLKRWTPRAMGKASPILKRTSHLVIRLGVLERNN